MSDDDVKLGKSYKGQQFVPVKTPEQVAADQALQEPYNEPGAVPLTTYFAMRGITNPVAQAGMRAYTKVQKATPSAWDQIFETY